VDLFLDRGRSILGMYGFSCKIALFGLCMIFGCMDWIVLVIFGDIFFILNQIYFGCSSLHGHMAIIIGLL
jgi:hypothetical protein